VIVLVFEYVGQRLFCWGGYNLMMVLIFGYGGQHLVCWGGYNYVMVLSTNTLDNAWFVGEVIIT
jgi:hypothetical protein